MRTAAGARQLRWAGVFLPPGAWQLGSDLTHSLVGDGQRPRSPSLREGHRDPGWDSRQGLADPELEHWERTPSPLRGRGPAQE